MNNAEMTVLEVIASGYLKDIPRKSTALSTLRTHLPEGEADMAVRMLVKKGVLKTTRLRSGSVRVYAV